jgi:hypothetical protein
MGISNDINVLAIFDIETCVGEIFEEVSSSRDAASGASPEFQD